MHKNPVWLALLVLIGLATLWFSATAFYDLYGYFTLTEKVPSQTVRWSIKEESPEAFLVVADYTFVVNDQQYAGSTTFNDWPYRNPWGAQAALKERETQSWLVWYSPRNTDHSSLQKSFPIKKCITMGILWGLLIYFLWLDSYVARYQR